MNKLSIIVPCYNENKTILDIINKLINLDINKEIIIVDGGSSDGTIDILKNSIENRVDKVLYVKTIGKGEAISKGLKETTGDIIVFQDADNEYEPNDLIKMLELFNNKDINVVYGSRFKNKNNSKGYIRNYIANKFLTKLFNMVNKSKLTDMETCYKMFRKNIIKDLIITENKFGLEPEISSKIISKGYNIIEVPISYYPRTKKEGKKIKFSDGIEAIKCIFKYRRG